MAGGFYYKIDGVWTPIERPYVKENDVWVPVKEAYLKASGVWDLYGDTGAFWEYDDTPSAAPAFNLVMAQFGATGRYINAGIRVPGAGNDADVKMVRVLTTYAGGPPTTQYGGTYTETPDPTAPLEPWSDLYYNGWGADGVKRTSSYYSLSRSTQNQVVRPWPRAATSSTLLPAGRYYFTAWSLDQDGNWSDATAAYMDIPQPGHKDVTSDSYFVPSETGTYLPGGGSFGAGGTWTAGLLEQNATGPLHGYAFYGTAMRDFTKYDAFTELAAVQVNTAQVQVTRLVDSGSASANLWMGKVQVNGSGALTSSGDSVATSEIINAGTIAKGESKWINIPTTWVRSNNFYGIKFWHKDPNVASPVAADYSQLSGTPQLAKAMQVHLNITHDYSKLR